MLDSAVSEPPAMPSYEQLAVLVAEQAIQLAEQAVLIEALRVELEALRRQAGRDSSNSSQPPSTDGLAAKAKAKAARRLAGEQAGPSPRGSQPRESRAGAGPGASRVDSHNPEVVGSNPTPATSRNGPPEIIRRAVSFVGDPFCDHG